MSLERIEQIKETITRLETALERLREELDELDPYNPWWFGMEYKGLKSE